MLHYRLHQNPSSSHQQISRLLKQLRPALTLDVGAAQGFLGQLLQGSGLAIDAVEPNPHWADHARPHYRQVFAFTIESAQLPPEAYDAIVCADVLEHLPDPAASLGQMMHAAAANAAFIISVPNVAHLAVRMLLMGGRFPKMDRGILDRTHLHFFTRDTAEDLLRDAGLRIERVLATGVPLEEVCARPRWLLDAMSRTQDLAVWIAPRVFGFQWIFLARKG